MKESLEMTGKYHKLESVIKDELKICCFSTDNPTDYDPCRLLHKGFTRVRMWVQYAKSHTGVCLIFDRNNLKSKLESIVNSEKESIVYGDHVVYDNKLSVLESKHDYVENRENFEKPFYDFFKDNADGYIFNKLADFRDEQEFRYAIHNNSLGKQESVFINIYECLSGIIVGEKFDHNYMPILQQYQKTNDVGVFQIYWNNGRPKLEVYSVP